MVLALALIALTNATPIEYAGLGHYAAAPALLHAAPVHAEPVVSKWFFLFLNFYFKISKYLYMQIENDNYS